MGKALLLVGHENNLGYHIEEVGRCMTSMALSSKFPRLTNPRKRKKVHHFLLNGCLCGSRRIVPFSMER
jgi:hypothetical protein